MTPQALDLLLSIRNGIASLGGSTGPGTPGATVDRELVVSTYVVKTAFTNAAVGDTITGTQILDVSGSSPTTVATLWRNQTQGIDLGSAPSAANLTMVGSQALTDAQLRASALPVTGTVNVGNTVTTTGNYLTDAQLRASALSISEADGANVTVGAKADSVATSDTGSFSLVSLFKRSLTFLSNMASAVVNGAYRTQPVNLLPNAGIDRSGQATTTSGAFNIAANPNRRPGDLQGQNVSGVTIGFNEMGGTAAIGSAGTYTVVAGQPFVISTNKLVNFIAASGTANITLTELIP